CARKEDSFDFW
nr:immunoglobulin heavy chain junction region [Macaca mulatta]MOW19155.1 immunoglobulin heavy chain junction region [Macaca mulatta]MOW19475.1 immunoglobulin heavy chain junction region [Macaca mulatta]MOW19855.1 immunoglobulin heavy chain junction region [Macaca mulatta]MOW20328.1 immunoglobulin heavy chain junction region [Macaca mulatta]